MKRLSIILAILLSSVAAATAQQTVKLVHNSSMDVYIPAETNGQMVLICPGGAYEFLCTDYEGSYVAKWMNERGIAAAVVKYALPHQWSELPLLCVQDAMVWCRKHAQEWGVTSIGVMGFSAGGHLAATTATHFVSDETRPDFAVLIYPVISMDPAITHIGSRDNLIGNDEYWDGDDEMHQLTVAFYSIENCVTENTPPTFLAHCSDDDCVVIENSNRMHKALCDFGVPSEYHIYPVGGHGFGFFELGIKDDRFPSRAEFYSDLEDWLASLTR